MVNLRLSNDLRIFLQVALNSFLLVRDAAIREKCHSFSTTELHQHVVVRDKKHLLDFMQLLEADNVQFARARRWPNDEAELFVIPLTHCYDVCSH